MLKFYFDDNQYLQKKVQKLFVKEQNRRKALNLHAQHHKYS